MALIITGASGHFGRATASALLQRVPARELILVTRNPARLADFAARGAQVRRGDFDDLASLESAFVGGERMLLISALKVGSRIPQHTNAIDAAVKCGVEHIVYTSFAGKTEGNPSLAVVDHRGTEEALRRSGVTWTSLRNTQYTDALIEAAAPLALRSGRWLSCTGRGKLAPVTRQDCVNAAVAVMAIPGHINTTYDITGPELLTFRDISTLIAEVAGKPIEYVDVDDAGMYAFFDSLGIPREAVPDQSVENVPWSSDDMVSYERSIRAGYMEVISNHVEELTGRKPKSFREFALERRADLSS